MTSGSVLLIYIFQKIIDSRREATGNGKVCTCCFVARHVTRSKLLWDARSTEKDGMLLRHMISSVMLYGMVAMYVREGGRRRDRLRRRESVDLRQ